MKTIVITLFVLSIAACGSFGSVTSNTTITPNNSFKLGNNEHGKFNVKLKNIGTYNLTVYKAPIAGGQHSATIVKPQQTIQVAVDANTALIIDNNSNTTASVLLKINGDTGLSMGYAK